MKIKETLESSICSLFPEHILFCDTLANAVLSAQHALPTLQMQDKNCHLLYKATFSIPYPNAPIYTQDHSIFIMASTAFLTCLCYNRDYNALQLGVYKAISPTRP